MSDTTTKPNSSKIDPVIRRLAILIFSLLFVTYGYFYQSGEHNENARFDQMKAIVNLWQLHINPYLDNTADVITIGDKAYPNKAPGMLILTLPVFFVVDKVLTLLSVSEPWRSHLLCYLSGWFSVGLGSALLGALLFLALSYASGSVVTGAFISLAYSLGTIAFPFSTLFFSHQLAASLVWCSFFIVFTTHQWELSPKRSEGKLPYLRSQLWYLGSGALVSLAAITEYPCALAGAGIGLYVLCTSSSWKKVALFVVGGLLPAIPLALYNLAVQGSLFWVTYSAKSQFSAHNLGFAGVRIPDLNTLYEITFKSQRGLFYINPWLLVGIVGLLLAPFRKFLRAEYLTALFIVVSFFAFNAGYGDSIVYWGGAVSTGPRHFIPALPFLALLSVRPLGWIPLRFLIAPLALFSVAVMLMATGVEPRVPYDYNNPLTGFFWPHFVTGRFSLLDFGTFSHILITKDSIAFNWGELLNLSGPLQLAPLLLFWGIVFILLTKTIRTNNLYRSLPLFHLLSFSALITVCVLIAIPLVGDSCRRAIPKDNHGLTGTYIRRIWWKDGSERVVTTPLEYDKIDLVRYDPNLDFDWMYNGLPVRGESSAEWRGEISIPVDGEYTFAVHSDDAGMLIIGDSVVVDNWGDHGPQEKSASVTLSAGKHPIIVRYYNRLFGGLIQLKWKVPGQNDLTIIPKENFTIAPPPL